MTAAQQSAFDRIEEIAREHFTASLFVAEGQLEGVSEELSDKSSDIVCTFHGGYVASIGLARLAELRVYKSELGPT